MCNHAQVPRWGSQCTFRWLWSWSGQRSRARSKSGAEGCIERPGPKLVPRTEHRGGNFELEGFTVGLGCVLCTTACAPAAIGQRCRPGNAVRSTHQVALRIIGVWPLQCRQQALRLQFRSGQKPRSERAVRPGRPLITLHAHKVHKVKEE